MRLRDAEEADCKFLYELRNHPTVREASFNTDEITINHHESWFKKMLSSPDAVTYIGIEDSHDKVGMVRFNKTGNTAKISVAVIPSMRGKGYGTSLIRDGCSLFLYQQMQVNEVIAEIKKSNLASIRAFSHAGFVDTVADSEKIEMRMFRPLSEYEIGLKIHSTNHEAFRKLHEFHKKKIIDFVELYVVPGVFDEQSLAILKGIPILLHAPNFNHNFNLRDKNRVYEESVETIEAISKFLDARLVIFHPGLELGNNDIKYIIEELKELNADFDIILENMPRQPIIGNRKIIGSNIEDFKMIVKATGCKICLDFGHAICSANYYQKDALKHIQAFINLNPFIFHISDGDFSSQSDIHRHLLEGDFPLREIIELIPLNSRIVLETPKSDFTLLGEDLENLQKLKNLIRAVPHHHSSTTIE